MPIDFTSYTDPGVYVEAIDPPVNNVTAITPTVVALIGSAGDSGRTINTSAFLSTQYSNGTKLAPEGIDPFSLLVRSRLNLTQYTNAAIGTVSDFVPASEDSISITVTFKDDFIMPDGVTNADFDSTYRLNIDGQTYDVEYTGDGVFTCASGSTGIHAGTLVNLEAPYVDGIKIGTLSNQLERGDTTFEFVNYKNRIKKVRIASDATDVVISYDGHNVVFVATADSVTTFSTAAQIKEGLSPWVDAAVTRYPVTVGEDTFYDYVIVVNDSNPTWVVETPEDSTGVAISPLGFNDGVILIDQERILVKDFDETSTSPSTSTIQITSLVRGFDGTKAASHGAKDVYFTAGYDYLVTVDPGLDSLYNGVDDLVRLDIVPNGRVSTDSVDIQAFSTDAKQYAPEVFNDLDNIRAKYGAPVSVNETATIGSNLTLAAQLAMRNGAGRVYCVAVEENTVEGFQDALNKLEGITEINVVVPIIVGLNEGATLEIIGAVNTFCEQQSTLGNLTRAFVGIDGNSNSFNFSSFRDLASSIRNSRISLVAPSRFVLQTASGKLTVGGSFAAAAVAGLHSALGPQIPLTRKQLEMSIYSIEDKFTLREMLECQSKGVLVLSQESNGSIIIRHGLTTDMTSVYSSEVSVVASRDRLRDLVYTSLLNAGILGSPMTSNTPETVVSNITGALETAKRATLIFDYADVKYRVPTNNPTAIEIRFAYRPTMPLNYILVQFSVDTTSSDVMFQSITEGGV